jgi:hypothetical protein
LVLTTQKLGGITGRGTLGYRGFVAGVSRIRVLAVAVVAAATLAATALAAPGDPKVVVKPADRAYARTIVLRKAALPGTGWKGAATDFGRVNPVCVVKHYSLSKLTANAEVGMTYTRNVNSGTFLVESDVHVFATPAQAGVAARTTSSLGYARCLGAVLAGEVPPGSFGTSTVKALRLPGLKAAASGFRITVHIKSAQGSSTLTATVIDLRKGRAVGTLSVLTVGKGWTQAQIRAAAAEMAAHMTKS